MTCENEKSNNPDQSISSKIMDSTVIVNHWQLYVDKTQELALQIAAQKQFSHHATRKYICTKYSSYSEQKNNGRERTRKRKMTPKLIFFCNQWWQLLCIVLSWTANRSSVCLLDEPSISICLLHDIFCAMNRRITQRLCRRTYTFARC